MYRSAPAAVRNSMIVALHMNCDFHAAEGLYEARQVLLHQRPVPRLRRSDCTLQRTLTFSGRCGRAQRDLLHQRCTPAGAALCGLSFRALILFV